MVLAQQNNFDKLVDKIAGKENIGRIYQAGVG